MQEDGADEVEKEISKVQESAAAARASMREKRKTAAPPQMNPIATKEITRPGTRWFVKKAEQVVVTGAGVGNPLLS